MATAINLRSLPSRLIRNELTQDSSIPGTRIISSQTGDVGETGGGFLSKIFRAFGKPIKVVGWIAGKIFGTIGFSFVSLWSGIVSLTSFIYNFDWNITDQAIDQKFASLKQLIAGNLGEVLGNAFGYLACGILPAAGILTFNEVLGYHLLKEVGAEALEELSSNLISFIRTTFRYTATALAYKGYKNLRRALKAAVKDPNSRSGRFVRTIFGDKLTSAISTSGDANSKPWSFRIAVEEKIESIQNPVTQEFVEEFYDEFKDSCVEAGYVIAQNLDSWVLQQKEQQNMVERASNIVDFVPNREIPGEAIILNGNFNEIRNQVITQINQYNQIESRDVGNWVGAPLDDSFRKPHKDVAIKILLREAPKPPYKGSMDYSNKRTQIEIPNANKAKIDWKKIRQSVGGDLGYLWGRFNVIAQLDDGHRITFHAASPLEGEKVLENLLELTNANLLTLNIHEEKKEGARKKYDKLYKKETRIYPAYLVVINQLKILNENEGKATTRGHKEHRQIKFPLYGTDKPMNFEQDINDLFVQVN